jgi:hypothetical protein
MAPSPAKRIYRSEVVRLAELARDRDIIEDLVFEDCHIEGPALIYLIADCSLVNSGFDAGGGPPDSVLWEVPDGSYKVGVIGLKLCTFTDCRFSRVGLVGTKADMDRIRREFGIRGEPSPGSG